MIILKELRTKKGLSQVEIAKTLKVSQRTYSNYEKGTTEPTLETLIKLADFFHISVDKLLNRNFEKNLTKTQAEIIDIIEQLPDKNQQQVLDYAKVLLENYKIQKEKELKTNLKAKK